MKRAFTYLAAGLIGFALLAPPAPGRDAADSHPLIKRALGALHTAQKDLQNAAHDYCGHRAEALEATNGAIEQLQQALNCAERKGTSAAQAGNEIAPDPVNAGGERHPNIDRAISALGSAESDLQNAAHDYCGHRVAALDAVHAALDQLRLAVQCDRK